MIIEKPETPLETIEKDIEFKDEQIKVFEEALTRKYGVPKEVLDMYEDLIYTREYLQDQRVIQTGKEAKDRYTELMFKFVKELNDECFTFNEYTQKIEIEGEKEGSDLLDDFIESLSKDYEDYQIKNILASKLSVSDFIQYIDDWGDAEKAQEELAHLIRTDYHVEERVKRAYLPNASPYCIYELLYHIKQRIEDKNDKTEIINIIKHIHKSFNLGYTYGITVDIDGKREMLDIDCETFLADEETLLKELSKYTDLDKSKLKIYCVHLSKKYNDFSSIKKES